MGNTNTIPVVSQVKSTIQLVTGDVRGAAATQEKFLHEGIGVSQITTLAYAISGNEEKAEETFNRGMTTLSNTADGIPVVGHAKGLIHYAMGDDEKGDRSMMASTRTTTVVGGGVGGFLLGGPVGAVAAGVATGNAFDITHSVVTDTPQGYYAAADEFMKNPSAGAMFDVVAVPVGDGVTGYQGGQLAKAVKNVANSTKAGDLRAQADTALAQAEAMAENSKFTGGEVKAQFDAAHSLFKQSEALAHGGKAPPVFDPKNPATKSTNVSTGEAVLVEKPGEQKKEEKEKNTQPQFVFPPSCTASTSGTHCGQEVLGGTRSEQKLEKMEEVKDQEATSFFVFPPHFAPPTSKQNSSSSTQHHQIYFQELYILFEEFECFAHNKTKNQDPNDPIYIWSQFFNGQGELLRLIQEYKQILKGKGITVTRSEQPFCKTAYKEEIGEEYNYHKTQVAAIVYEKTVADEFQEDCPLRGFQVLITLQRESFGSLHTLLSHPQDMYSLIPDLDLTAYPVPYHEIIKQEKPISEGEKKKLVRQTKENYQNEPESRLRMRLNELRLLAYLRSFLRPENYAFHQFYMPDDRRDQRQKMRVVFNVPDKNGKIVQLCVCLSCDTITPGSAIIYKSPGKDGIVYDCYEIITAFIYRD